MTKDNLIKYIKKFMPLIGIALLIFLIVNIGIDKIASTFLRLSPIYIIAAASLTIPRLIIINFQWQLILKKQKIHISYIKSLKIYLMSYFYASITPGYIGQLMRIPYLKDETNEPFGKLFVNTFVQTSLHTLSLYCMMIIGTFLVIDKIPQLFPLACAYLLVTIIIYIYFLKRERGEKTLYFLVRLFIPKSMKPHLTKFVDTFYKDFPSIRDFILPFIVAIPEWILIFSQIYIIGLSLNIQIPYFTFLMLYSIANVVSFIPITAAGLGTREATLILLFSFYGVAPEETLVISLAGYLLTDLLTGFYGIIISISEAGNNKKSVKIKNSS